MKERVKKIGSLIIAVCMVISMFPANAWAEPDGMLSLTDYVNEPASKLTIPAMVSNEVTTPEELKAALISTTPAAILVTGDIDMNMGEDESIQVETEHTLIIEGGKTVDNINITIQFDKTLTVNGPGTLKANNITVYESTLKLSEDITLEIGEKGNLYISTDGNIYGENPSKIILKEGAKLSDPNGVFNDRGISVNRADSQIISEDGIPSSEALTAGEYIWDETEQIFKKEGKIPSDSGYGLIIANIKVDESNAGNITGDNISGKVSYDKNTGTLTLSNANICTDTTDPYEYAIYSSRDITIKLEGSSTIGTPLSESGNGYSISYGIYAHEKNIKLAGSGRLYVNDYLIGILGKNITVDSTGIITIKEYGSGGKACCFKANGGALTINSGTLNLYSSQSNGLYGDTIYINGGTITAYSKNNKAFNMSPAFGSSYKYTIKAGSSEADASETSSPTFTEKYIKITQVSSGGSGDSDDNDNGGSSGGSKNSSKTTSSSTDSSTTQPEVKWINPFADVKEDSWFYEAVKYVDEKGLMKGTENNTFDFGGITTRGMIVTILHRLEGTPTASANIFSDVNKDEYYADAAAWAAANSIIRGYGDGKFGPEAAITREQLAVILMNYAKLKGYDVTVRADLSLFADYNNISDWAAEAMSWAAAAGLIQGTGTSLIPAGNATRAQVAVIFYRFAEEIAK